MRILLDEMMPRNLRRELRGHTVLSIEKAGLKGLKNGALLAAASPLFDAILSMDSKLEFTQNIAKSKLRFVILHAFNNKLDTLRPLVPEILLALNHVQPGQIVHVPKRES